MWLAVVVIVLTGYLLGNLNGSVMISMMQKDDVRNHGSGNGGLTNFVRNFGYGKALGVIAVDLGKAVLACLVGRLILEDAGYGVEGAMLGGVAVSLGHDFPVLFGFRGGKGILSGLGIAAAVDYRCALLIIAVFVLTVALTRYVSLGSVIGAMLMPVLVYLFYPDRIVFTFCTLFAAMWIVILHKDNLIRLKNGTESKITLKKHMSVPAKEKPKDQ